MFSVRLVKADHYMCTPIPGLDARYSEFRGTAVKQVPVIRIFGSTSSGQKVCLHVHGVFPYIYIPYDGCIEKEKFIYQIASAIDKALNVSLGNSNSHTQHVYKITHVSAIPFYGYHSQTHQFLKIYFYNPLMIKKASDLLQNGVILGQVFQPHEAHIPFILQFCMDYNLQGMSFVNLASVRYRQGTVEGSNYKPAPIENVSEEFLLPERILRLSTCSLEVDGVAADILNRQDISGQLTSNPGLKAIWDEEKERRRNENRNSQFTPQSTQARQPSSTASERFHLGRLKKRLTEIALLRENSKPVMERSPSGEKLKPYPAPSPEGEDHLNASVLLTHVDSLCHEKKLENTSAENLKEQTVREDAEICGVYALSNDPSDSEPISSQSSVLNSQCLSLVQILQDLIEDDSVLGSQQQEANGEDNERESDDDDDVLSQSLDCKEPEYGNAPDSPSRYCTTRRVADMDSSLRGEDCFALLQVDGANDVLREEEEDMNQKQLHQEETQQVQQELSNPVLCESELGRESEVLPHLPSDVSLPLNYEPGSLPDNEFQMQTGSDLDCKEGDIEISVSLPLELSDNADDFTNEHSEDYLLSLEQCSEEKLGYFSETVSTDSNVGTDADGLAKCLLLGDPWLTAQPTPSEKDEFLSENFSSPLKDSWAIDTENSNWIPTSEKYFSETSMITLPEVDVSLQYESGDFAEMPLDKRTEPNSVSSSETKRRLCSLIKSRTKAREAQSSDKMNSELISVDEIVNCETTCVNEYENSTFSAIFQNSDYEEFLDDSCQILNGVEGSFLNENGLGSDMKTLVTNAGEEYNKNKDEYLDDMCNRLQEELGEMVLDNSHNTPMPKNQWLLDSRDNERLRDHLRLTKRRGRKPKWLKELEMKLNVNEQVEDTKTKFENNYQLRNRRMNTNKKGRNSKHLNVQLKRNQHESESAKKESPVEILQDSRNVDNRTVKERLGILVRKSIGKKHSNKESSLEEVDCSHNITSQRNNQYLNTSLATENLLQSEQIMLPGQIPCHPNALHLTKKEKCCRNKDSIQKTFKIEEKEVCDDDKFDITTTCLTELSLQFDEHEVNSRTIDTLETPVITDNEKEDVELAKKRMGQYVRQRLGILVESRSKLNCKSTDEVTAVTSKVPNPNCEAGDNCSKVLTRHHRNRRKVVRPVELDTAISKKINVNGQNSVNDVSVKKSEMFSNDENSCAINTCAELAGSSGESTVVDSVCPINITTMDAVLPMENSASLISASIVNSASAVENELQSDNLFILKEREIIKESSNAPDAQCSQAMEDLLNLYSIQQCYVKLQKCNLNKLKNINAFKSGDETINCFKSARRKASDNLHHENLMCSDGQRSSESINDGNELIKIKRNEKDIGSCNFQNVLLANTASGFAHSLYKHKEKSIDCSELNMKCVVPNSPKTLDKSVSKTGEVGSLKAVVQAESPRVADTLDTLPNNPAQTIRHYALGGGTFIDPTENQSVHLVGDYLREGNIVEVAKIPTLCSTQYRSGKTSENTLSKEENDLPSMNNPCSASLQRNKNINSNKNDEAFMDSDVDFLSFTRGSLRKRSSVRDEQFKNKREKINEKNPSNVASVMPNDVNLLELSSYETEDMGEEPCSEICEKEIFEESNKKEFVNNDKCPNRSNSNLISQCRNKEFEAKDLSEKTINVQLSDVMEEVSASFVSRDLSPSATCIDEPQPEFKQRKVLRATNKVPFDHKMSGNQRKLQIMSKNTSKMKLHAISRLHKKSYANNKYQAIKSISLKHTTRKAGVDSSLSVSKNTKSKHESQNSSNEKTYSSLDFYYNTRANCNTKQNSFHLSKRITSPYKSICERNECDVFEEKPSVGASINKFTNSIQQRQVSVPKVKIGNKNDSLRETRRITRQNGALWKNESDRKLQSDLRQPEVHNFEVKLPLTKNKPFNKKMVKHITESTPVVGILPKFHETCISMNELYSLRHCKGISSSGLSISGLQNRDLAENVEANPIETEPKAACSDSVNLMPESVESKSMESLQNKMCKDTTKCESNNISKEPFQIQSTGNKLLEKIDMFTKETSKKITPENVSGKKTSTSDLFRNTRLKNCHAAMLNSLKRSKRIASAKRLNSTLENNDLGESLEEETTDAKFENIVPFDSDLNTVHLLSKMPRDLPNIALHKTSEIGCQNSSKVQSKLQYSEIQSAKCELLDEHASNDAKGKLKMNSKTLSDGKAQCDSAALQIKSFDNDRISKLNSLKRSKRLASASLSISGINQKILAKKVQKKNSETKTKKDDSTNTKSVFSVSKSDEYLQNIEPSEIKNICESMDTIEDQSQVQSSENKLLDETVMTNNEACLQSTPKVTSKERTPSISNLLGNNRFYKKCPTIMSNSLKRSKRIASVKNICSTFCKDDSTDNLEEKINEKECDTVNLNLRSKLLLSENARDLSNMVTKNSSRSSAEIHSEFESPKRQNETFTCHNESSLGSQQSTHFSKKYRTTTLKTLKPKRIASAKKSISVPNKNVLAENLEVAGCEVKQREDTSSTLKSESQTTRALPKIIDKNTTENGSSETGVQDTQEDNFELQKVQHTSGLLQNSHLDKKRRTTAFKSFKRSQRISTSKKSSSTQSNNDLSENLDQRTNETKFEENVPMRENNLRSPFSVRKHVTGLTNTLHRSPAENTSIALQQCRNASKVLSELDYIEKQSAKKELIDKTVTSNETTDYLNTEMNTLPEKTSPVLGLHQKTSTNKNPAVMVRSLKRSVRIASSKKSISVETTENCKEKPIPSPAERNVLLNSFFKEASPLSEKIHHKPVIAEKNDRNVESAFKPTSQSDLLHSEEQNTETEQPSRLIVPPNCTHHCENTSKYTFHEKEYCCSESQMKTCTEMKCFGDDCNTHVHAEKIISARKSIQENAVDGNFVRKSEVMPSMQNVSINSHLTRSSLLNKDNSKSNIKKMKRKKNGNKLKSDNENAPGVRLEVKYNNIPKTNNKWQSKQTVKTKHQKAEVNSKYHAIKLISVKRSKRMASTNKLIPAIQQYAYKNFKQKQSVTLLKNSINVEKSLSLNEESIKDDKIRKAHKKNNIKNESKLNTQWSVNDRYKLNSPEMRTPESKLPFDNIKPSSHSHDLQNISENPSSKRIRNVNLTNLKLHPTSEICKSSENISTNRRRSKNTFLHLKDPIVKLNPLNCSKLGPSSTTLINDNKNNIEDFERLSCATKSSVNISSNIQERPGPLLRGKVCNDSERTEEIPWENTKSCNSEHSVNVQSELDHSYLKKAEYNHSFDQMVTSINIANLPSTTNKKKLINSTLHVNTCVRRNSQKNNLNRPILFEENFSSNGLTLVQDHKVKDGDNELKSTTKLKDDVAVNTRLKEIISVNNTCPVDTLQEVCKEVALTQEPSLKSAKMIHNKDIVSNLSPLQSTFPGENKNKLEKKEEKFVIGEDVARTTRKLQTSIPCVDGANDSLNADNSNDLVPFTVADWKFRKRGCKQVLKLDVLTPEEPTNVGKSELSESTRKENKIRRLEKSSPAKLQRKQMHKPLDVMIKRPPHNSKILERLDVNSSFPLAVGATRRESMMQVILVKYLSSVLKRSVTKRDIQKFEPHVELKRLNSCIPRSRTVDIHSLRLRRRKLMDELCICAEHGQIKSSTDVMYEKGVSLDHQHSEHPWKMTYGCIHHGGQFAKVFCQHTGTDEDQQNQILINNEKTVIGSFEVLNSTPLDSRIEASNVNEQISPLKSTNYACDLFACNDCMSIKDTKEMRVPISRDISSTKSALVLSVDDFKSKESNFPHVKEISKFNREPLLFSIKDDTTRNYSQDCIMESSTSNTSIFSTANLSVPVKLTSLESSMNRKAKNRNNIIIPKKMPPSRNQIFQSLSNFNLAPENFLKPFFSNPSDVVEKKEVGHKDLKIHSRSVQELELFESMIANLKGLKKCKDEAIRNLWEQSQTGEIEALFNQGNLKEALGGQRETILTPSSCAPSVKEVKLWAKARLLHKQLTKENKRENQEVNKLKTLGIKEDDKLELSPAISSPINSQGLSDNGSQKVADSSNSSVDNLLAQTQFRQQLVTPQTGKSNDTLGFKMSYENLQDCRAVVEHQYLTLLAVELHIQTRGDLRPDPAHDSVCAIFYCVQNDVPQESLEPNLVTGMIVVQDSICKQALLVHNVEVNCKISYVSDEKALMEELIHLVRLWDPDILAGYEVEMLSWGYLFERAFVLEMNLCPLVSRIPGTRQGNKLDESVMELSEEFSLLGRIVLNVWRLMRHEVSLQSYTFENVSFHVLHERIPLVSFKTLSHWWGHRTKCLWGRVADHYLLRVRGIIRILEQLDLVNRTCELARIFGIQFYEVLSRGSQFRVESMMLRLAKPMNYIPVSPSVQQRARMRAPEYLQLIMEPESQLYVDPVIVLDFQSLYPSMIIAYNYCFSTCLGRIEHLGQTSPFEFGSSHLRVPPEQIKHLLENLHISPSGEAFVNSSIRKGIMPLMLEEILNTRLMVKKSMKEHKDDKTLQRVLHSRQLGLKLIANVTYGYTAANFSGRMACVEIADSVVSKGRETLERAIHLVENTPQWGARVVYGDTDSLFVLVPGRSREDAFAIGSEIAEAVTQDNPSPVKLKLEKVYQPCILQTKKRYVGYMYESSSQKDPIYDAKGIETVRRDGCPAVAKVLEKSLRLLFETKDVSTVKAFVQRKFSQILEGQMSIQDLTFAREYRGKGGYKPGACVPALELTKRWLSVDPRAEPRVSERVPYIVISGAPNVPLIHLVRSPHDLLAEPGLKVHAHYYVSRVLCPPLARCFSLLGADVMSWYTDLPRRIVVSLPKSVPVKEHKKLTISQYFSTSNCAVCHQICQTGICSDCQKHPQVTVVSLATKIHEWERHYYNLEKICQSCCRYFDKIECVSLDCPVMYYRNQARHSMMQEPFIRNLQENLLWPEV